MNSVVLEAGEDERMLRTAFLSGRIHFDYTASEGQSGSGLACRSLVEVLLMFQIVFKPKM